MRAALGLIGLLAAAPAGAAPAEDGNLRRFALVLSSNDGGQDRVRLRYAGSDASAFADVLVDVGGVQPDDLVLLHEPAQDDISAAFDDLSARILAARADARRVEVVVYYSGHSDDEALLPGGEAYSYRRLRTELARLDVDVRVSVLDSCSSGSIVRAKGGSRRPGFLVDASHTVKGEAFLTSSTADEASQESDRIGASFFTHHLVAALRGAADRDGDGLVTLGEAYSYTFRETRESTEHSRVGPQSPSYALDLAGEGDVIMTDLRQATSRLRLDESLDGELWLRTGRGDLYAAIDKVAGRHLTISVPPGTYEVTLRRGADDAYQARVVVGRGETPAILAADDFSKSSQLADNRLRGGQVPEPEKTVPVSFQVVGTQKDAPRARTRVEGAMFNLFGGTAHSLAGGALSFFGTGTVHDVEGAQIAWAYTRAGGDLQGFQGSMFANVVGGKLTGVQSTFGVNVVGGDSPEGTFGTQLAGIGNVASGGRIGGQLSTLFNVNRRHLTGAQVTAGVNVTGGMHKGVQIGLIGNHVQDRMVGWQWGGLYNTADGLAGLQLAAVNHAGEGTGVQLGLVNVARQLEGFQLGLINVADQMDGEALGLITIARNGYHAVELGTDDLTPVSLGVKFGSPHIYTTLLIGMDPVNEVALSYGGGFGGHATFFDQKMFLDADLVIRTLQAPPEDDERLGQGFITSVRATFGGDIAGPFGLWIGPAFHLITSAGTGVEVPRQSLLPEFRMSERLTGAVGYQAGMRVRF